MIFVIVGFGRIRFRFYGAGRTRSLGFVILSRRMFACSFLEIHMRNFTLFTSELHWTSDEDCMRSEEKM
jgi:hypothetical protein